MKNNTYNANKNMVLFLLGKLVSLFGSRIYGFAMSLYILKVTGSALNFSISILLSTIPALIMGPIGGVISDKVDRKKLVLLTDAFSGVVMFVAFFLSHIYGLQLWIIYGSTVLLSVLNTLFSTSFDAALPNIVSDESLGEINSYNQAINSLSTIVAPILGGVVYSLVEPTIFIVVNGISFVLSAFSESFIDFYWKVDKKVETFNIKEVSFFEDIREGINYVKKRRNLVILLEATIVINFLFTVMIVAIPHLLVVQFTVSDKIYGGIEAMFGIGSLLVSIILANRLGGFKPIKMASYLIVLGFMVILCSIPAIFINLAEISYFVPVYYGIMYFIIGSILVIINIPIMVYIQETTEDEYRGRVMSVVVTISTLITPLGFLIHGILLDYVPTYIIIIYAGAGLILIAFRMIKKFAREQKENTVNVLKEGVN